MNHPRFDPLYAIALIKELVTWVIGALVVIIWIIVIAATIPTK